MPGPEGSTTGGEAATWRERLAPYRAGVDLFSRSFLDRWGDEPWAPTDEDRAAAAALHVQIVSRVASQRLGYSSGVEAAALDSLYRLFDITRELCVRNPGCRHFEAIAWEILNGHVRSFTAKWHRRAQAGALEALDASDEFRAELGLLRPRLGRFDDLLIEIRDGAPPRPVAAEVEDGRIALEMRADLRWGTAARGGLDAEIAERMDEAEKAAIGARRRHYGFRADKPHAVGLALSGGGIRSATFSLGVLVALARRNVLPKVDYLSTVSGGGYVGSFLTVFLNGNSKPQALPPGGSAGPRPAPADDGVGLRSGDLPFRREEGEAEALRHIRHRSRYLSAGSVGESLRVAAAQLHGLLVNVIFLATVAVVVALADFGLRVAAAPLPDAHPAGTVAVVVAAAALALPLLSRLSGWFRARMDAILGFGLGALALVLLWEALGALHSFYAVGGALLRGADAVTLAATGAILVVASLGVALLGRRLLLVKLLLVGATALAAPVFVLALELAAFDFLQGGVPGGPDPGSSAGDRAAVLLVAVLAVGAALAAVDVNQTAPHRHYREKLAAAFLIRPADEPGEGFAPGGDLPLSEATRLGRSPYHLINCALNVPSSREPRMQGRLTDFFLFSPAFTGSPLTGYAPTKDWEDAAPRLDVATAMAVSGAAAAPQMGLATVRNLSFWLALLNLRLGQWVRVPATVTGGAARPRDRRATSSRPGLTYLLREMTGLVDERHPFVNVTDGGHIENLGVYELLRRRCKFVIAVDGEQDPAMTFWALTNLQRLASIDLGVTIDIDLDDLRLDRRGLSRSHFRFCRIRYPAGPGRAEAGIGYLLYVKLSLTGNEGEFIRRYRLDQPAFPHHPTADQFFTEAQFEAYRSLGEHVGDKLFLRAIVGRLADAGDVEVEDWFETIGTSVLEPIPGPAPARPAAEAMGGQP